MNDIIKNFKKQYLASLKNQLAAVQNSKQGIIDQKYAEKKANSAIKSKELDEALARAIKEITEKANAEIEIERKKVADKKLNFDTVALAEAQAEAEIQVNALTAELSSEIEKTEKELQ